MKRIENIHNKTKDIDSENLPYNNKNILLQPDDLRRLLDNNGLKGIEFKNINLYRVAFVHKSYCTMKNTDFEKSNINCSRNLSGANINTLKRQTMTVPF